MCNINAVGNAASKFVIVFLLIGPSQCTAYQAVTRIPPSRFSAAGIGIHLSSKSSRSSEEQAAEVSAEQLDSIPRLLSEGLSISEDGPSPGAYSAYSASSVVPMAEAAGSDGVVSLGYQDPGLQAATKESASGVVVAPAGAVGGSDQAAEPVTGGHIAGIVIGVAAVAGVAGLVIMWHKKRQAQREDYIGRYQRYGEVELS